MMTSWWFVWMVFIFIFLVTPISYGWGYRGWGPPYPRYLQRRRALRASPADIAVAARHHAWGWRGDFVWAVLLIGSAWALAAMWLR